MRYYYYLLVIHKPMAEDEDINIIKKAEKEKKEKGVAEKDQHNRNKETTKKKDIPPFAIEQHIKNKNENTELDENDNYIHRRMHNQKYIKNEKMENKSYPEKEHIKTDISYSKYAVGGESKEVPASALDDNDNFIHRREQNQQRQVKSEKKK